MSAEASSFAPLNLQVNELVDTTGVLIIDAAHRLYDVNGTQILTTQQAAILDATLSTGSNTEAINSVLAALRAHGLIAT